MSEQIRDGFESWCKTLGFNIDKFDEDYIIASTEWAWKIWQASRAALVIELPSNCKGMAITVDELRVMMKKIGVIIK